MANGPARLADLDVVLADLKTLLANCDTDLANGDSDRDQIARIREQAMNAFGAFGEQSGEPS